MIFKQASSEEELFEGMIEAQENAAIAEDSYQSRLLIRAMEELNAAAESFERAGFTARAKEITAVMISLAEDKNDSKKSKVDKSNKDEVRKVFMFFGFGPDDLKGLNLSSNGDTEDGE